MSTQSAPTKTVLACADGAPRHGTQGSLYLVQNPGNQLLLGEAGVSHAVRQLRTPVFLLLGRHDHNVSSALGAVLMALSPRMGGLAMAALAFGLIGFAQTRLHHDGPVRRYLTEAIFPYYIAHQTIIVAAGFWLKQTGAQGELAFGVILLTTMFGCALTYEVARRVNWLRPLLGLKALPVVTQPAGWITKVRRN